MKKIIFAIYLLLSFPCFAETVECEKMKGVMLNIEQQYIPIPFEADKVIFNWETETGQMITGKESMSCAILENNDNLVTCININNMVTYSKTQKLLFYSKHNALYQSAYHAKCQPMK